MPRKRKLLPGRQLSRLLILLCLAFIPLVALGGNPATGAVAGTQQPDRPYTYILRVYFKDMAERDRLATELNAEEVTTTGGFLTVLADRPLYDSILARGLRVEVDEEGTTQLNNPNLFGHDNNPNTFDGGYRTVEEVQTFLDQYAALYPTLVQKVDIGDSWCKMHGGCTLTNPALTWPGYDIFAFHITNQAIPGPKPVFWYDATIHAREIAVPEIAMRYIQWLLDGYDSNPDAHWLVDYHDIWVIPMVNPDGHHMVEVGGSSPIGQRKNANYTNGCTTWGSSSSQLGTDNNRNFPFQWGCCGGSSTAPCDQTYRGPSGNSDPETQAIVNQVRLLIPDQRGPNNSDPAPLDATGVYQNMHSNAALDLYPWGWTTSAAPNSADLANIAKHMSASNANPPGNTYQACQPPLCLYAVDGAADDWAYGELGPASFTTEIGGSSFYPSYSTIDSTLWPQNRGALIYQAKIARTPYLLTRGPDTYNVVTNPMTVTQGSPSQLTATINYSWTGNGYSQNVSAAEYYVDTPPWAGGTPFAMDPTDGNFNSPTEGAQATIDTTSIPAGRHLIFVRGRGVNDYGGFGSWGPISAAWLTVTGSGGATPTNTVLIPTATRTNTVAPTATRTNTVAIPTATRTNTVVASPTSGATATCVPAGGIQDVAISSFAFTPPDVTIPAGTTVRWTNTGGTHTTTSDTGVWDSGVLAVDGQFSFTFNTPGSYPYHCSIHPALMTGTITVLPASPCATPTNSPVATATRTNTAIASTATRTNTIVPTPSQGTPTPVLPTATRTNTQVLPSSTPTRTNTVAPTQTAGGATATTEPSSTSTDTPFPTPTNPEATATSTACAIEFTDVPPDSPFYVWIRCLACRGVISGYSDGTFRPGNDITRGQIAKMVSNAAGFEEDPGIQIYEDVDPLTNPFYQWINRLTNRGFIGGYPCGTIDPEPCVPPDNRPYFRTFADTTRGQLSKIVANAAGVGGTPTGLYYTDVPEDNPFYLWIMRLTNIGVMSGYDCGGPGEPCDDQQRPYFRPFTNVTRGQASKIVANTFFPDCQTPVRR